MRLVLTLILFCLLVGCTSRSLEDFREEGEGVTRSLVAELKHIHSRRELIQASPKLKILFLRLASVANGARELQRNHPLDPLTLEKLNHQLSDELRFELNRIYQIDGGRELIEKCQEDALRRLLFCD